MKKKLTILCAAILAVLAISVKLYSLTRRGANDPNTVVQSSGSDDLVAGPGTIEPVSEEIKLGSELSGKLKAVSVGEGDRIHKGQVLAVLENDDYRAELDSAVAEVQEKEAALRKVVNGARSQERLESLASLRAAEAVMKNAQSNLERRQELFTAGVISREEMRTLYAGIQRRQGRVSGESRSKFSDRRQCA
jgi:multidrug efflux pump subunit AcrA (membrane-fusion protein)